MKILVVEDDDPLREAIVSLLQEENYLTDEAATGDEGLYLAQQGIYDLLILDIMLPEISGLDIVRKVRAADDAVPILLLTARDSVSDKVCGLETGADDYLVKPFAIQELLARIKALIRRRGTMANDGKISYGGVTIDSKVHDGYVNKQSLGLTTKEYELLEFLILNKEQILTREQIFDRVWGFESETTISVVDLYIHYLRKKMAPSGHDSMLRTVRGAGFMFKEN
ncbi:response regulator transcription factor [Sporomusa acidovorans]|uniref:Response regulator ArlR n=1 Tax=Sporomusa acidovorans (strain ATCC 49682 / DSM 3132 / Mol) TaxID=1123286 RepID=A0ABZ3IXF6_SPOA4|nr:response regulator transcription factor [Sporomusa acidovorans]OZC22378.1 response regulator ArlR [Sporomusa acidovorans DSM 3132]SDE47405.1 DNA-binding response regulator, OmpR family, contains REC and winged-helix (wHTH) domain [Sporomusa acidovorans]